MQVFGLWTACMKINQILYVIFKPQVSFCLYFATPFSVMTHYSSEIFQLKQYMLWTKRAYQCTIFRLLSALMKVDPIPHAFFVKTSSGFIQILHYCSVSWKITPLNFFLFKPYILWTKIAHWSKICGLLRGWVKRHQIPPVIFEMRSQLFL